MASPSEDDDLFDSINLAEHHMQEDAYKNGLQAGSQIGHKKGSVCGIENGINVSTEIGFYHGFVEAWHGLLIADPDVLTDHASNNKSVTTKSKRDKVAKCVIDLRSQFQQLQLNPENQRLTDDLIRIRNKFKQLCSLLKYSCDHSIPTTKTTF